MIRDARNRRISELFDIDTKVAYHIPRYQREYTWGKGNWEALYDDILDSDSSYFLGSIICINQTNDSLDVQRLELVDGQQRLTTVSLLFLSLYSVLKANRDQMTEDQIVELFNLKNRLLVKATGTPRLVLQHQNFNNQDYQSLLHEKGLIEFVTPAKNRGNRKIYKCYRYYENRITEEVSTNGSTDMSKALKLLDNFLTTSMVKIEVGSHSGAYTLFESLNNRGVPLTPIDIIKNKLLAELERNGATNLDQSFEAWQLLLTYLGDDYSVQERFFRQYYNGFKNELRGIYEVPIATKSNLIRIYEQIIQHEPSEFLASIMPVGNLMAQIMGRIDDDEGFSFISLRDYFTSLERIQGAPSYLLLLNLLHHSNEYDLSTEHLTTIIRRIISFFVRRNITGFPPTYDLTRLFMAMMDTIHKDSLRGDGLVSFVLDKLKSQSSSDEQFRERLSGMIYDENSGATRFILCSIAEADMNAETKTDLWRQESKRYIWTIEHIFPQGENIPEQWVEMIANGDSSKAEDIREQYVHKLGNLTITGYNSSLGNAGFINKRDRMKDGNLVGYKNGLSLNEELKDLDTWTVENIESRTLALVERTIELFSMS